MPGQASLAGRIDDGVMAEWILRFMREAMAVREE